MSFTFFPYYLAAIYTAVIQSDLQTMPCGLILNQSSQLFEEDNASTVSARMEQVAWTS